MDLELFFDPRNCAHTHTLLVCRPDKNGNKRYQRQCKSCGEPCGRFISKEPAEEEMPIDTIPLFDETLQQQSKRKIDQLNQGQTDFELTQMRPLYNEYMNSPSWFQKRDRVLKRANGMCEGAASVLQLKFIISPTRTLAKNSFGNSLPYTKVATTAHILGKWTTTGQKP